MNKKLTNQLFKKYPKIFRQKDLPMTQTAMCWGIACSDYWFDLLDETCDKIQKYIDESGCKQVEAIQVKEKFGMLRFYTSNCDAVINSIIAVAVQKSAKICEVCGSGEDVTQTGGWVRTLCKNCIKKGD